MSIGISAYGCHLPVSRLPAPVLSEAWGHAPRGLRGKRVAGPDEDALTLAVAAASNVADGPFDLLALASTSLPYRRRVQVGLVARSLGLEGRLSTLECTTSSRAGTEALIAAVHAVAAAGGAPEPRAAHDPSPGPYRALVVASEVATGGVRGGADAALGAGAAALVVRESGEVATIDAMASCVDEDPGLDFVLSGESSRRDVGVSDYAVEAYVRAVGRAAEAVLERAGRDLGDYRFVSFDQPDQRLAGKAARALGLERRQWQEARAFPETGDVGAAGALLGLSAALDAADPGDRILLVAYGGGSAADAVSLEVGDGAGRGRLAGALAGATDIDYTTYLKLRGGI